MTVLDFLLDVLVKEHSCSRDEVGPDARFVDDLGLDSLDLVEVRMSCEERYRLELDDDDLEPFPTVGEWANFIQGKISS